MNENCWCLRSDGWFLSAWMCSGDPRSREAGVSRADRQRPAAVPLPAREQREPEQPHQESPAHHHQVQHNSTLLLRNMGHSPFTLVRCNSCAPSALRRFGLKDLSVVFLGTDNKSTFTFSIPGLLDSLPGDITLILENMSESRIV